MRGSNDKKYHLPSYRWVSFSSDGGWKWSKPEPWTYTDGEAVLLSQRLLPTAPALEREALLAWEIKKRHRVLIGLAIRSTSPRWICGRDCSNVRDSGWLTTA